MKTRRLVCCFIASALILTTFSTATAGWDWDGAPSHATAMAPAELGPDPDGPTLTPSSGFLENLGQFGGDGTVLYYQDLGWGGVALAEGRVLLNVQGPLEGLDVQDLLRPERREKDGSVSRLSESELVRTGCVLELTFRGANPSVPMASEPLPGVHSFFLGSDPAGWHTGVRSYAVVTYQDLWDGIDLAYRLTGDGLKYEFVVHPGADLGVIEVAVAGHTGLAVEDGELVIMTPEGEVRDGGLTVFHADSPDEPLEASFHLAGEGGYGFSVPGRDADRMLVIDPFVFSTFLGGGDEDMVSKMVVDASGALYCSGVTASNNFPITPGCYQRSLTGIYNGIVTKIKADGSGLVWSTYLGGTLYDACVDLAVDDSGDVYIAGGTMSDDFPTTAGCYQPKMADLWNFSEEGFVTKLTNNGQQLGFSTYLGSDESDFLYSIDIDDSGNSYVTGYTASYNLTTTSDAYQDTYGGDYDSLLRKLDSRGANLLYSTYLGGEDWDEGYGVIVHSNGDVCVAGLTYSWGFPNTTGCFQDNINWAITAGFVTKFKADLSGLVYSTYLGGTDDQELYDLVVNDDGNATVTGYTTSTDFPTTRSAYQTNLAGWMDAFLSELSSDGRSLVHSTFLGGDDDETGYGLAVDEGGRVHATGYTWSSDFPTTPGAVQTRIKGDTDAYFAVLDHDLGSLEYGTYLGGNSDEEGRAAATQGTLFGFCGGVTYSNDFPTSQGAYQSRFQGVSDGFLCKFSLDTKRPVADAGLDVEIDQHETVWFNGTNSTDNVGVVNWTWSFTYRGTLTELYGDLVSFTFDDAGVYGVSLRVSDLAGLTGLDTMTVTVRDITPPVAHAGSDRYVNQHEMVIFDSAKCSDNVGIASWTWTFDYGGGPVELTGAGPMFTFHEAGDFNVTLVVADAAGLTASDSMWVHVKDVTNPTANAGPDVTVDQHAEVTLDGGLSEDNVGIANWTWSFIHGGSPVTLYGESVSFVFDNAGAYEVTLTVEDAVGNRAMDTVKVNVADTTPPEPDAGEDQEVDQGTSVFFDGRGSRDNVRVNTYKWTFQDQGMDIELEGSETQYFFAEAGTFLVTLTVTDLVGNVATDTMTVTVRDTTAPVPDPGDDIVIDQGDTARFDGSGSIDNVGLASWTWTFTYGGEEQTLTGVGPTFVFDLAGEYVVYFTVTDDAGNLDSATMLVTVRDTTAPVANTGADRQVDQGTEVPLDGTASSDNVGIKTYEWTFTYEGIPVSLKGATTSYYFTTPGQYVISLTVTDAAGNSASDSFNLKVRDTVLPVAVGKGTKEVRAGDDCTFDASLSYDNVDIVSYKWSFKEGGKAVELDGEKVKHAFDEPGTYKVTLTVTDADGNVAIDTFEVTVTGGALMYAVLAIVVVAVLVALGALMMMRRRRGAEGTGVQEEAPEGPSPEESGEEPERPAIEIEERWAE